MTGKSSTFSEVLSKMFQPDPWHGVNPTTDIPGILRALIETVPSSSVKTELDKAIGHLAVDRPQRLSSKCPTLYGYVPQTYCGKSVAELCAKRTGRKRVKGDGDPLDICVLTAADFPHGGLFVRAKPIGGLRMIDKGEADDKIIAVLDQDVVYGDLEDIRDCPPGVITQLEHYFLNYKRDPQSKASRRSVRIEGKYGPKEAWRVINLSRADYDAKYGRPEDRLEQLKQLLIEAVHADSKRR